MPRPPKPAPGQPLLAYFDERMADVRDRLRDALAAGDGEAVHAARVGTRRLSAGLDLMEPVLSKKPRKALAKGLKRIRKTLGPLRDADVTIDHLSAIADGKIGDGRHADGAGWLREQLESARHDAREADDARKSAEKALARLADWDDVRGEMAEAGEAVRSLLAEAVHNQLDAFVAAAGRLASAESGFPVGGDHADPHAVRLAGKSLRYTLEMAAAEHAFVGRGVIRAFKKMQDQLGAWHDDVVLAAGAVEAMLDADLLAHDPQAAERVMAVARYAARRSARHLAKFTKAWRRRGGELTATIRSAFPLTAS